MELAGIALAIMTLVRFLLGGLLMITYEVFRYIDTAKVANWYNLFEGIAYIVLVTPFFLALALVLWVEGVIKIDEVSEKEEVKEDVLD